MFQSILDPGQVAVGRYHRKTGEQTVFLVYPKSIVGLSIWETPEQASQAVADIREEMTKSGSMLDRMARVGIMAQIHCKREGYKGAPRYNNEEVSAIATGTRTAFAAEDDLN